jgi:hypothetical protein
VSSSASSSGSCSQATQLWQDGTTSCSSDAQCVQTDPNAPPACRGFCITGTPPGPTGFCFSGARVGVGAQGIACAHASDCAAPLSCCTFGHPIEPADDALFGGGTVYMCAPPGVYSAGGTCGIQVSCAVTPSRRATSPGATVTA